jgi:hypothetical protein
MGQALAQHIMTGSVVSREPRLLEDKGQVLFLMVDASYVLVQVSEQFFQNCALCVCQWRRASPTISAP